jgi:hypothetical protein
MWRSGIGLLLTEKKLTNRLRAEIVLASHTNGLMLT